MRPAIRVLYLLRPYEPHPPDVLIRAASSVHKLRAGNRADGATRDYGPQLIAFSAPFDHDTKLAVERLQDLELSTLCIGGTYSNTVTAHVSESIGVEDLRTVLELLAALANQNQLGATECRAEDMGHCRGRVTDNLIRLLEHLLTSRLPDYAERGQRVVDAALWIGSHLCLPPHELKDLVRAARLREIGKLALPDRVLFTRKSERSAAEQAVYSQYPKFGARPMRELPQLRDAATIVEHQLENFDGSGPAGLMAHQVPLGSRVLRVAATLAALLAESATGAPWPKEKIFAYLDKGSGSLYDPLLVKLVENYYSVERSELPRRPTKLVRVVDLAEGMVLAEDVWSRSGMKIMPCGARLTQHMLNLMHQFQLDPSLEAVQVFA